MKCPICKRTDSENLLIDQSLLHDNDYYYFYCVLGCDAFTMEKNAFEVLGKAKFNDKVQKELIKLSLTKVLCKSDIESFD